LDNKYLNPPINFNYDEYLNYVHKPVEIFKKHALKMKEKKITELIIEPESENILIEMNKNISTLLKILNKLNNVSKNHEIFKNNNSIENYFHLKS
jgi:hypothetical protein